MLGMLNSGRQRLGLQKWLNLNAQQPIGTHGTHSNWTSGQLAQKPVKLTIIVLNTHINTCI